MECAEIKSKGLEEMGADWWEWVSLVLVLVLVLVRSTSSLGIEIVPV